MLTLVCLMRLVGPRVGEVEMHHLDRGDHLV